MSNEELIKKIDEDCALATQEDDDSMFLAAVLSVTVVFILSSLIIYGLHNLFEFYLAI